MIAELARQGLAIIFISSELPELVGMCDSIVVLREGRVTARFSGDEVGPERVIRAATDADRAAWPPSATQIAEGAACGGSVRGASMASPAPLPR